MPDTEALEGSDLVLLMLAAPTDVESAVGRVNGITRLEKLLYLTERETDTEKYVTGEKLGFVAYNYGPFSKGVYEAVEILEQSKLIHEERLADGRTIDSMEDVEVTGAVEGDEYVERQFVLTREGQLVADLLAKHYPEVVDNLSDIKNRYASRTLSSLIRYVYRAYPESAANSKIAHKYL